MARISVVALSALLLFSTSFAQETGAPDQYSAVWAVVGGSSGGTTVPINIRIKKYSTAEDIKTFSDILREGGPTALRRALEKEDAGQLSPVGRVGVPIAIARRIVDGNKVIIRVVTVRNLSFVELRYSGRSVDYPYTFLELVVDQKGTGTGTAIGAAKIRFNQKSKTHEIESLQHGTAYNKLLNVRLMN